jgi:hypothetical protein
LIGAQAEQRVGIRQRGDAVEQAARRSQDVAAHPLSTRGVAGGVDLAAEALHEGIGVTRVHLHFATLLELDPGLGAFQHERCRAAAAALIGLLSRGAGPGQTEFTLRQGHEMGRPSTIQLQLRIDDGKLTHGGIGGDAIIIGEGVLELDD